MKGRKQPVQQNLRRARKAMKQMVAGAMEMYRTAGGGPPGHVLSGKRIKGTQPGKQKKRAQLQSMMEEISSDDDDDNDDHAEGSSKRKQNFEGGPQQSGPRKKKKKVFDDFNAKKLASLPRKERRRMEKKLKKSRRNKSSKEKSAVQDGMKNKPTKVIADINETQISQSKASEKRKKQKKTKAERLKRDQEEARKVQLIAANKAEDKTIKKLEKDLKFRKKKKTKEKITPAAFRDDGLDYLLDIVNPKFLEAEGGLEEEFLDLGKEPHLSESENDSEDDEDHLGDEEDDDDSDDDDDDDDGFEDDDEDDELRTRKVSKFSSRNSKATSDEDDDDEQENEEDDEEDDGSMLKNSRTRVKRKRTDLQKKKGKRKRLDNDSTDDDLGSSDIGGDDDGDEDDDIDNESRDSDDSDDSEDDTDEDEDDEDVQAIKRLPKMDPYGNVIGAKKDGKMGAYVPPHLRAKRMGEEVNSERREKLDRLRKQLKGQINRLSESNAQSICNCIEELYLCNSRNDMNETLTSLIQDACISPALTPERLIMEHVLLVSVLHLRVGSEVGAHLLQALASRLDSLHGDDGYYGDNKELDNIVLLLVHLYNFKIVHSLLIYDLIKRFAERFTERDIEMLLHILRSSGSSLRKDDPSSLKDIILLIQGKASSCSEELKQQSRVRFMLETIGALRNNNLHKIPNYDPTNLQRLRTLHKNLIKDRGLSDSDSTLRISLADLINAKERGRWWIIGSAWSGHGPEQEASDQLTNPTVEANVPMNDETSQKIVELSRQQRMNTDLRRTIFSIIMTAEDYMDAFEKLVRLGQKGGRDREVVQVCLDCCRQEKVFNPYYGYLASKLCQFDRKFRMAFQFALWDKISMLEELTPANSRNLAMLLSHLIASKAQPLTVLKVIEFADINKHSVQFLQTLLQDLLLEKPENTISSVFGGIAAATKLCMLREGLGLFMHHFLTKAIKKKATKMAERGLKGAEGLEEKLRQRISIAETAMNEGDGF